MTIPEGSNYDIWRYDLERGNLDRISTDPGEEFGPVWHPLDGGLAFSSESSGEGPTIFALARDASDAPTQLVEKAAESATFASSYAPDGSSLVFTEFAYDRAVRDFTGFDIWTYSMTESDRRPLIATDAVEHSPVLSPDGHWIAYVSNRTGSEEVYVRSYPDGDQELPVSAGGGTEPLWSPMGRELFYRNGDQMLAVPVELEPELDLGANELLFERRYAVTNRPDTPRNYDVSLDGQRFLMIEDETPPFADELHVVTDWFDELRRLVPVD